MHVHVDSRCPFHGPVRLPPSLVIHVFLVIHVSLIIHVVLIVSEVHVVPSPDPGEIRGLLR